jgi:hypothetical protein
MVLFISIIFVVIFREDFLFPSFDLFFLFLSTQIDRFPTDKRLIEFREIVARDIVSAVRREMSLYDR